VLHCLLAFYIAVSSLLCCTTFGTLYKSHQPVVLQCLLAHYKAVSNLLCCTGFWHFALTLILLMWRIWGAHNIANKWQMGFNSAFKDLKSASFCAAMLFGTL
jgi:hypothetical protein